MTSLTQRSRLWFVVLAQRSMARAWLLLVLCLALTIRAWRVANRDAAADTRTRFDVRKAEIINARHARMAVYEQVLRGALGLLCAAWVILWRAFSGELYQTSTWRFSMAMRCRRAA